MCFDIKFEANSEQQQGDTEIGQLLQCLPCLPDPQPIQEKTGSKETYQGGQFEQAGKKTAQKSKGDPGGINEPDWGGFHG